MGFLCKSRDKKQQWTGEIHNLRKNGSVIEAVISGRGSAMHVIIEKNEWENFLCIPDKQIRCALAELDDVFWNQEQLGQQLGDIDTITITEALRVIAKELESMA